MESAELAVVERASVRNSQMDQILISKKQLWTPCQLLSVCLACLTCIGIGFGAAWPWLMGYSQQRGSAPTAGTFVFVPLRYETHLISRVLGPLNMTRTGFRAFQPPPAGSPPGLGWTGAPQASAWPVGTTSATIEANQALGLQPSCFTPGAPCGVAPTERGSMGWGNPYGGMTSTADDIARFLSFTLTPPAPDDSGSRGALLSAPNLRAYLAPGFALADGLDGYGAHAWERQVANGFWWNTKGGLTSGAATSVALSTRAVLPLGVVAFSNVPSAAVSDGAQVLVKSALLPPLVEAIQERWLQTCTPLPRIDDLVGTAPCVGTLSRDPTSNCSLLAERPGSSPITLYNSASRITSFNQRLRTNFDLTLGLGWTVVAALETRPRPPTGSAQRSPLNMVYSTCAASTEFNDAFIVYLVQTAAGRLFFANMQFSLQVCEVESMSDPAPPVMGDVGSGVEPGSGAEAVPPPPAPLPTTACTGPLVEEIGGVCTARLDAYHEQYYYVQSPFDATARTSAPSSPDGPYCPTPLPPLPMTAQTVAALSASAPVAAVCEQISALLDEQFRGLMAEHPHLANLSVSVAAVLGPHTGLFRYNFGVATGGSATNANTAYNIGSVRASAPSSHRHATAGYHRPLARISLPCRR